MKKFVLIVLAVGLVLVPGVAHGQAVLGQARLDAIGQRCTVIQTILDQTQRRDLVARTNRGRDYEATIKQLDALAERLRHNNMPTQSLDTPANEFKVAVDSFRTAYVRYDDSMSNLRRIDCHSNQASFATALGQTRALRQAVGAEVAKGEEALNRYRRAVVALQDTLPPGQEEQ